PDRPAADGRDARAHARALRREGYVRHAARPGPRVALRRESAAADRGGGLHLLGRRGRLRAGVVRGTGPLASVDAARRADERRLMRAGWGGLFGTAPRWGPWGGGFFPLLGA